MHPQPKDFTSYAKSLIKSTTHTVFDIRMELMSIQCHIESRKKYKECLSQNEAHHFLGFPSNYYTSVFESIDYEVGYCEAVHQQLQDICSLLEEKVETLEGFLKN
ncbi:hypothetical protein L1887_07513 [Cichorium endivia]|nr:hypothetical protein L1887_07513 [Cichorium endivia]